jgi:hypothetical protein
VTLKKKRNRIQHRLQQLTAAREDANRAVATLTRLIVAHTDELDRLREGGSSD